VHTESSRTPARRCRGLGLDAGGTFTDAAIVDFASGEVLAKAKAPTDHRDLAAGVAGALAALDPGLLTGVDLVSLSTTLATNALVEERGSAVGLLLLPPTDAGLEQLGCQPYRVVPGRLSVDGRELQPIDPDAVREAAAELLAEGVEAFAVSGYGGANNPVHEQAVKAILNEFAPLPVVCGHELTGRLNFLRRAVTAVLNARLMPLVGQLFDAVAAALAARGVRAPLYLVRGDGSLLRAEAARQRPIETILSGPAASVTGARFLTGVEDLVVVDIGGTTTDVAVVADGRVTLCPEGAVVGPWRTSIAAADLITSGLGGDSQVHLVEGGTKLVIGPARVQPLSFTAAGAPAVREELAMLAAEARREPLAPLHLEFFALSGPQPKVDLSDREQRLWQLLASGPCSRLTLAAELGVPAPVLVPSKRLEQLGAIRRCAFTPTDALHVLGRYEAHDTAAATHGAAILAAFARREVDDFCRWVVATVEERLAAAVLRRELSLVTGDPEGQDSPVLRAMLDEILSARRRPRAAFELSFTAKRPIVGLGAPAAAFVPAAAALLGGQAIVPPHAEVANAIGAVTGRVALRAMARIQPEARGGFTLVSTLGRAEYASLAEARAGAAELVSEHLRASAPLFGTAAGQVTITVDERHGLLADGGQQLLEVVVEGHLDGEPVGGD
jgi:N-methylhydantoinase A/oxoprolinase/acetone carboxylase beta subunit